MLIAASSFSVLQDRQAAKGNVTVRASEIARTGKCMCIKQGPPVSESTEIVEADGVTASQRPSIPRIPTRARRALSTGEGRGAQAVDSTRLVS